jgi:hypothetical protein
MLVCGPRFEPEYEAEVLASRLWRSITFVAYIIFWKAYIYFNSSSGYRSVSQTAVRGGSPGGPQGVSEEKFAANVSDTEHMQTTPIHVCEKVPL